GGAEALLVAFARFSDLHADVDDAGGQIAAAAVETIPRALKELRDTAIGDDDAALDDAVTLGVNEACVGQGQHGASPCGLRATCRLRASSSITAMRTATPISTCSWMTLTLMSSANSPSISTPRFIGPGCMTMASGFALASFSASSPKRW